jgi:hypothetical protein
LTATHAWYQGQADDATSSAVAEGEVSGWGAMARGGVGMRLAFDALFLSARSSVGGSLARLHVTDGEQVIGGLRGVEWSSSIGLGWSWKQ